MCVAAERAPIVFAGENFTIFSIRFDYREIGLCLGHFTNESPFPMFWNGPPTSTLPSFAK